MSFLSSDARAKKPATRLAVLIPCFNEEVAIGNVVAGFAKALPSATVYVYDNNSKDRTKEKAVAVGAVVRSEPLQGLTTALEMLFVMGSSALQLQKAAPTRDAADAYIDHYLEQRLPSLDANDAIVHIFRPEVRKFYNLEKMWGADRPGEKRQARA